MSSGESFKGDRDPSLPTIRASIFEKAEALGTSIDSLAEEIKEASTSALRATRESIIGTELAEEWPLISAYGLQQMLISLAEQRLKGRGIDFTNPVTAAGLDRGKYGEAVLAEVYGANPKIEFVHDLIDWADRMAEAGKPVLVHIDAEESGRVGVSLYEDVDIARDWMQQFTDGSFLDEESQEDGRMPNLWASSRVVVGGDVEFLAHFSD